MRNRQHLVITGTGRSATGYIARVLQTAGVEVGHEGVFGPLQALGEAPVEWRDLPGDSSWLAVPLLETITATVVLQVRHPVATIASLVGMGLFADSAPQHGPYRRVIEIHAGHVLDHPTEVERAAAFWTLWTTRARRYASAWYRVEDLGVVEVCGLMKIMGCRPSMAHARDALANVPSDYNSHTFEFMHRAPVVGADIPRGRVRDELQECATAFGYDLEATVAVV